MRGTASGLRLENMLNTQGLTTPYDLDMLNGWSGTNKHGSTTGDDSGPFPDNVMETYLEDNSSEAREIMLRDLDPSKVFDLVFFSSQKYVGDSRVTTFTVNGNTASLIVDKNTSETASLFGLSPNASGELLIEIGMPAGTVMKYINAMEIRYYDEPEIPFAPNELNANALSEDDIELSWTDMSTNEEGFRVYMSTESAGGPWNLIATVAPDVESYGLFGLEQNTLYYFQVAAYNGIGENLSNTTEQATYIFKVYVNFNASDSEGTPWNNFERIPEYGEVLLNTRNSNGDLTGIEVELGEGWTGDFSGGYIDPVEDGIYPDNVMLTYYYVEPPNRARLTLKGLNFTHAYDVSFLCNWRFESTTTFVEYEDQTVSVESSKNINNLITLRDLRPNENGEIDLYVYGDAYAVINGMEINVTGGNNVPEEVLRKLELEEGLDDIISVINPEMTLFPNPASDRIKLRFAGIDEMDSAKIEIYDTRGRLVFVDNMEATNEKSLLLDRVGNGVYIVKVTMKEFVLSERLVITK